MKCIACGHIYDDKEHDVCPNCKLPPIVGLGDADETSPGFQKVQKELKEQYCANYSVYLCTYRWEKQSTGLPKLKDTLYLKLGETKDMEPDHIYWLQKNFARSLQKTVLLDFELRDDSGNARKLQTTIEVPTDRDFWKIGFSVHPGNQGRFHILSSGKVTDSNIIQLS